MTGPLIPSASLAYGNELNAVYAIARIVAETFDTEAGLDAVFRLARTIFIFDTVALYLQDDESDEFEPIYARALGRGRSKEAELAWGEPAAAEAFRARQTVLRKEDAGPIPTLPSTSVWPNSSPGTWVNCLRIAGSPAASQPSKPNASWRACRTSSSRPYRTNCGRLWASLKAT